MASFATMKVDGFKLSYEGIGEILKSDEVASILNEKGAEVADSMNGWGMGEFRSFPGDRGNRCRNFVVTYDRHAKRTANIDPGIFARHV